jgi:hypothetical protein
MGYRDYLIMKNLFGFSDAAWAQIYLLAILYICFLTGISRLKRRPIAIISIAIGSISGLMHFVFIGSAADMPCGMLLAALLFPLFCRIAAELGSKARNGWISKKYDEKIPIRQVRIFFISLLFLFLGIFFTVATCTWYRSYKHTFESELFRTVIDLSRRNEHAIPFDHNWLYAHGYALRIKPDNTIAFDDMETFTGNRLNIHVTLKDKEGIGNWSRSLNTNQNKQPYHNKENVEILIHLPLLIALDHDHYVFDILIDPPTDGLKPIPAELSLLYTHIDIEKKYGIASSIACFCIFFILLIRLIVSTKKLHNNVPVTDEKI